MFGKKEPCYLRQCGVHVKERCNKKAIGKLFPAAPFSPAQNEPTSACRTGISRGTPLGHWVPSSCLIVPCSGAGQDYSAHDSFWKCGRVTQEKLGTRFHCVLSLTHFGRYGIVCTWYLPWKPAACPCHNICWDHWHSEVSAELIDNIILRL